MDETDLKEEIMAFLTAHKKAVLALIASDGKPRTSLMLYACDDDFNIYFGTRRAFGKYESLKAHPHVSLTVVGERLNPLKAVDIRGGVEFIADDKMHEALEFFESKNSSPYYIKTAEDFTMFKVTPSFVRWMDATSGELIMKHLKL